MKSLLCLFVLTIVVNSSGVNSLKSYRNYKVVSLEIDNETQLKEIQNLELQVGFVFLDPPLQVKMKIELVIDPKMFDIFEDIAEEFDINFKISTNDLQSWIDMEKLSKTPKEEGFALDKFNELEDIYEFIDGTGRDYPERATIINIGESYEAHPLKVVKISTNDNNPVVFIEANIHAREWISSATAVWLINEFLTLVDADLRELIDSITWYFLPVMNPDGYKYTHDEDRLWRKTRSIHNIFCRGVDANRNFEYNFRQGGSSKVACTDTYSGPEAFSEMETRAVRDFYSTIADKAVAYISFHSAAQLLLYPMGHTNSTELVPNVEHLHNIAEAAVDALEARNGVVYRFGNIVTTLYVASGSSSDHAYGHFKTPLAYTYELRAGRGTGSSFILPPDEIVPNSKEIFDSIMAMMRKAKEFGYFS